MCVEMCVEMDHWPICLSLAAPMWKKYPTLLTKGLITGVLVPNDCIVYHTFKYIITIKNLLIDVWVSTNQVM